MNYLVLSASLHPTSRSRHLAELARPLLERAAPTDSVDALDLRDHPLPLCDGSSAFQDARLAPVRERLERADGILCAVPIYTYNVSSAFKNLVELAGRDAWTEKVVAFVCAAGGRASYMSVMAISASLMLDFRTVIVPRFVYADRSVFSEEGVLVDEEVRTRLGGVVHDLVRFTAALRGEG